MKKNYSLNNSMYVCAWILCSAILSNLSFGQERAKVNGLHTSQKQALTASMRGEQVISSVKSSETQNLEFSKNEPHGQLDTSFELMDKRDRYSKTFANPDGSFSKTQSNGPIHYKDINGNWLPYDAKLVADKSKEGLFKLAGTDLDITLDISTGETQMNFTKQSGISFGKNADIKIINQNGDVDLLETGEFTNRSKFEKTDKKVVIKDVFSGIDRIQNFEYYKIKTDYIINERPVFNNNAKHMVFEDEYIVPQGYKIVKDKEYGKTTGLGWEGDLLILDENNNEIARMHKPIYFDASAIDGLCNNSGEASAMDVLKVNNKKENQSNEISGAYEILSQKDGVYKIRLIVPVSWLNDENTVYPVVIDPTASMTYSAGIIGSCLWGGVNSLTKNIAIPAGSTVTAAQSQWQYTAQNWQWMSEVYTRIGGNNATYAWFRCAVSGGGTCNVTPGAQYNNIANGLYPTGIVPITIGITRVWGGSGCNTVYSFITNNTWITTITYTAPAAPSNPTGIIVSETSGVANNDGIICSGASATLTANGAVGTVYWFTGACGTTGQIGTGNSITVNPTTTTTYFARNFNGGQWSTGCASTTITVNALSSAPTLSGTSPVCSATLVVLTATGGTASPGSTINWYTGPNGSGSFLGTGSTYTVTPSATTTYYARRQGGCNITADGAYTITVNNPTLSAAPTTGDMVWRGASSTDWATLPNWWQYNGAAYVSATAAPTTNQNVIIPANQACVLNQPNTNANSGAAKTLRIENGATLSMTNGSLTVAENWVNNGTFTPGTGTVTFTGSGTHTISGSSGAHNFHNLTMNKTGEVQLSVPIAMTGALTLTNGRLNIGNSNLDLPTNSINGGNANSYVRTSGTGVLMRNVGATAVNFPVGRGAYNPASLANSGTLDKYNVRVIDNVTDDGTAVGATTTMAVVNRTWMINEQVAGGSNVNLTLQWNGPAEGVNNFDESSAFIAHYMAADGLWDNIGGTVQTAGVIQTGGITNFSPFTVSSDNSFAPLPVKLTSFQANCTEKGHNSVTWQTESETNSSHFIVERSRDGAVWSTVSSLPAAGTSVELKNYAISDISAGANFEGYYRLRQVDFDGEQEVFGPISINCDHVEHDYVEVYPNPSNGNFKARVFSNRASANVLITVCASNGKVVHQQMTSLEKGLTTLYFEQNQLEKGMYFIQIESENSKLEPQKLIIH